MSDKKPDHSNRDFKAETKKKREQGKDLGGRPRFEIKYKQLLELCGIFCTGEECAAVLGCSYDTLNLRLKEDYQEALEENGGMPPDNRYNGFKDCFEKGSAKGRVSLRRTQFKMATDPRKPDKTMSIWLGKNNLGQTDRIDHSSKDGSMSPSRSDIDLSKLSHDDFTALGAILDKSAEKSDKGSVH